MVYAYILIGIFFALLVAESWFTRISLNRIRIKIHVNGTRGKSTITRYIATALRTAGIRTIGKVTGEIPTLIQPDGAELPIRRRGPARISEQFRIIRRASKAGAEALVLECMSIDPALQRTEGRYFSPDIYVLSNIRDDHREKMGQSPGQRTDSYCQAVPRNTVLVSNDPDSLDALTTEAEKKNCRLVVPENLAEQPGNEWPYGVFPTNIELAVEAAVLAGVDRAAALASIINSIKEEEPGLVPPEKSKRDFTFLNAFKVNDPDSATDFFRYWSEILDIRENMAFVFNTRSDRPLRTDVFSDWIKERKNSLKLVYITGDHRERAYRKLKCLEPDAVIRKLNSKSIKGIADAIEKNFSPVELVIGIGNIKGDGYRVIEEFSRVS